MTLSKKQLIARLDSLPPSGATKRVRLLLESENTQLSTASPIRNAAGELLRLWRTRSKTSRLPAESLQGIKGLVMRLQQMPTAAEVEQFNFKCAEMSGSIFFDAAGGGFLGDTFVKRRAAAPRTLQFGAPLLPRTRKSA